MSGKVVLRGLWPLLKGEWAACFIFTDSSANLQNNIFNRHEIKLICLVLPPLDYCKSNTLNMVYQIKDLVGNWSDEGKDNWYKF